MILKNTNILKNLIMSKNSLINWYIHNQYNQYLLKLTSTIDICRCRKMRFNYTNFDIDMKNYDGLEI